MTVYICVPCYDSIYIQISKFLNMDFEEIVKKKTTKKRVQFESEALLQSDGKNKSSYQVKILVTKEEAIRLLSKCKDGNILEFKDVANQLAHAKKDK